jgi:hypothetical protein
MCATCRPLATLPFKPAHSGSWGPSYAQSMPLSPPSTCACTCKALSYRLPHPRGHTSLQCSMRNQGSHARSTIEACKNNPTWQYQCCQSCLEGASASLPAYHSTNSKTQGMKTTILSAFLSTMLPVAWAMQGCFTRLHYNTASLLKPPYIVFSLSTCINYLSGYISGCSPSRARQVLSYSVHLIVGMKMSSRKNQASGTPPADHVCHVGRNSLPLSI